MVKENEDKKSAIYNKNKIAQRTDKKRHYIDKDRLNKECNEYYEKRIKYEKEGRDRPPVNNYIGESIKLICENVSYSRNFVGYTYRDEMVNEAIWDCLKAIMNNYNPTAKTRSGKPNAFGYFTQIAGWAMVRVIKKEKGIQDFKNKILTSASPYDFIDDADQDAAFYIENMILMNIKD